MIKVHKIYIAKMNDGSFQDSIIHSWGEFCNSVDTSR